MKIVRDALILIDDLVCFSLILINDQFYKVHLPSLIIMNHHHYTLHLSFIDSPKIIRVLQEEASGVLQRRGP